MKKLILAFFCLWVLSSLCNFAYTQGFRAPSDSNAVVYFVRVTKYAGSKYFDLFHEENLIGLLRDANFMRFEYPHGKHIFWASSSNKQFLNCDLMAGGTYLVLVHATHGNWGINVVLEPLTPDNPEFDRAVTFVKENFEFSTGRIKLQTTQADLNERGFIALNLDKYERGWNRSPLTKIISPDMAIPESYLK